MTDKVGDCPHCGTHISLFKRFFFPNKLTCHSCGGLSCTTDSFTDENIVIFIIIYAVLALVLPLQIFVVFAVLYFIIDKKISLQLHLVSREKKSTTFLELLITFIITIIIIGFLYIFGPALMGMSMR